MDCPNCGAKSLISDTRTIDRVTYRRRKCSKCKYLFYTEEIENDAARDALNRVYHENLTRRRAEKKERATV